MRALESLIDNSSDVISLVNPAGRVLYASASSTTIFGYRPEEIVGRDSFDLIHPEDQDQLRRALDAVLDTPSRPNSISVRPSIGSASRLLPPEMDDTRLADSTVAAEIGFAEP